MPPRECQLLAWQHNQPVVATVFEILIQNADLPDAVRNNDDEFFELVAVQFDVFMLRIAEYGFKA